MSQSTSPPGFFGKVPARGDFLDRRMPAGFQSAWESWLSAFVVAARDALGTAWPEAWLTAPLWHFTLGRDIVRPFGAAGVVLASVDRVGRFFPFTIAGVATQQPSSSSGGSSPGGGSPGGDRSRDDWARAVEALAVAALDDDFNPDRLDEQLRDLGPPPAVTGAFRPEGVWALPIQDDWPAPPLDALADSAWLPPGADQSAWWCRGSDSMAPLHLRVCGLPGPATSAAMVTGRFDLPGAEDLPVVARPHTEVPVPDMAVLVPAPLLADPVLADPLLPDPLALDRPAGHPVEFDPLRSPTPPVEPVHSLVNPPPEDTKGEQHGAKDDPLAALTRDDDPLADRPLGEE
jgi:type VI secretion system protein ImpM